jgi:hypothetical protein
VKASLFQVHLARRYRCFKVLRTPCLKSNIANTKFLFISYNPQTHIAIRLTGLTT